MFCLFVTIYSCTIVDKVSNDLTGLFVCLCVWGGGGGWALITWNLVFDYDFNRSFQRKNIIFGTTINSDEMNFRVFWGNMATFTTTRWPRPTPFRVEFIVTLREAVTVA